MLNSVMSPGQAREFHAKLVRLAPDLDPAAAQKFIDGDDAAIRAALATLPALFSAVPADGVVFELTLDGDAVDPLAMVRADGYSGNWQFPEDQPRVRGKQTRLFRLVRAAGSCMNFVAVVAKVGPLAEGQWREAFRLRFRRPDGNGPIGFGGSEWVDPGGRWFPCLDEDWGWWHSDLVSTRRGFDGRWRWLVPAYELVGGTK